MKINNLLEITTRQELREWLLANHKTEKECWVIVSIKEKPDTILYLDAVEEAICFGWIDGIKKKISDTQLAQRLSPRTKKSSWTELNKERARRLEKLGLMTDNGRKTLPDMSAASFVIDDYIKNMIKEDIELYNNFKSLPQLYIRIRIDNIQRASKDKEQYMKRLDKFLINTRVNKIYGKWNDDGRLVDY